MTNTYEFRCPNHNFCFREGFQIPGSPKINDLDKPAIYIFEDNVFRLKEKNKKNTEGDIKVFDGGMKYS